MAIVAADWDEFIEIVKSLLDRFQASSSVLLLDDSNPRPKKRMVSGQKQDVFEYSLPKSEIASSIIATWKKDRRSLPRAGVVFPEGSILTILFVAKTIPFDSLLQPVRDDIAINDLHGEMIGFIDKYSYCFYPNSESADEIGYFRYDFHADKMGSDGDLGEHSYFHFHREHKEESFRHASGPVLDYGVIVSGLERKLAPKQRQERLNKKFKEAKFSELLLDLTVSGIMDLRKSLFNDSEWRKASQKRAYDEFIKAFID